MNASTIHVCNGDADGLCAAVQWRLHAGPPTALVTGMKRDIELLERVDAAAGDEVDVFDVSMERNRAALLRLLQRGVRVRYFDHHRVAAIPSHRLLAAEIDAASDVCTSLLVDRAVAARFRHWALVGAYGDNLAATADRVARESGIEEAIRARLRRIGVALNYNAYGASPREACIAPAALYDVLARYRDPLEMAARETLVDEIEALRQGDLERAAACPVHRQNASAEVRVLPDAPWTRRVLGTFANELANADPRRAHAVLGSDGGGYVASVRAPLAAPAGAHELCRRFGGGGRDRAAGIDALPAHELDRFVEELASMRWGSAT